MFEFKCEKVLCSTGKETFFLTDRSQPKRQRKLALSSSQLRSNRLTLFNGVTAVMSVVESDCRPYDEISTKLNNRKPPTMSFVGIVTFGLVSGSYYDVGGASDINALKTGILHDIQFAPHREQPVLGVKTTVCQRSTCDWLFVVG